MDSRISKINNVIEQEYLDIVLNAVKGEMFTWNLIRDISSDGNHKDDISQYAFRHKLWWENQQVSQWTSLFDPLIEKCVDSTEGSLVYIPKVFMNMNMNYGVQNKNLSHCDGFMNLETERYKRYTGIYYLEDSDGDTLFYLPDGETISGSFPPEKNTMLIFPSGILHSRQLPMLHNTRLVLNINILIDIDKQYSTFADKMA